MSVPAADLAHGREESRRAIMENEAVLDRAHTGGKIGDDGIDSLRSSKHPG